MAEKEIFLGMNWTNLIALSVAVVSLLGVIVSLIIGLNNSISLRKNMQSSNFVGMVTTERNKWLEKMRQDISNFCGLTIFWLKTINRSDTQEGKEILKEIDKLIIMLKLRLNPNDNPDIRMLEILDEVPRNTDNAQKTFSLINEFTELSQKLLKNEWEKVKKEARKGEEVKGK